LFVDHQQGWRIEWSIPETFSGQRVKNTEGFIWYVSHYALKINLRTNGPSIISRSWSWPFRDRRRLEIEARGRSSRFDQCEVSFFIDLNKPAVDGDRKGAGDYFKKGVATGISQFPEHRWSRSLLATMYRYPNWPKKGP
jgi:hypothetical protein